MDRNIKKLSKSIKVPKWNPNDWNIKGKLRKKINTRKWDDINVPPRWGDPDSSPVIQNARNHKDRAKKVSHSTSTLRRQVVYFEDSKQLSPILLPEEGSVFLKKNKPPVFFSSMGHMHESCGTLTVSRPPVSPEPTELSSHSSSHSSSLSESSINTVESESCEGEDSDNVVVGLTDSDSIYSNDEASTSEKEVFLEKDDDETHIPVSDIADVFSAKLENSEPATEICIEKEQHWNG